MPLPQLAAQGSASEVRGTGLNLLGPFFSGRARRQSESESLPQRLEKADGGAGAGGARGAAGGAGGAAGFGGAVVAAGAGAGADAACLFR